MIMLICLSIFTNIECVVSYSRRCSQYRIEQLVNICAESRFQDTDKMGYISIIIVSLLTVFGLCRYFLCRTSDVIPEVTETWWTPGNEGTVDDKVTPYRVTFSQELVQDLKYRLKHTRDLTPPLKDVAWTYGTNTDALRKLIDYWANDYNFQKREDFMNQFPHFKTNIQGLDIHFLHVKPKNPQGKRVLPLMLVHGWPGSIMEFYKVIPILTAARPEDDFVFELVIPSLPGFGFSSAATIPGLSSGHIAVVLKNLMLRLGFNKFYVQGGDWGAFIVSDMSILFPQHVLGMHSNMCAALKPSSVLKEMLYSYLPAFLSPFGDFKRRITPTEEVLDCLIPETGYFHIQATKPDTVGVGLNDSPAGLASYIIEKFSTGTNFLYKFRADGGILEKFTYNELIDNLMIYWASNSMTTAMRIYREYFSQQKLNAYDMTSLKVTVPSACVQFPNEIIEQPINILKEKYPNLVRHTKMSRGGHFAAMEEPELLANDIWASIGKMKTSNKQSEKKSDL